MEEPHIYELVGSRTQNETCKIQSNSNRKRLLYMVPRASKMDREDQYEDVQLSTIPLSTKQSQIPQTRQSQENCTTAMQDANARTHDNVKKKKRGCIVACIFITMFTVVALVALAVSALSLRGSLNLHLAVSKGSQDITYLKDEINALKGSLAEMNFEILGNISQLDDRLRTHSAHIIDISSSIISQLDDKLSTHSAHIIDIISSSIISQLDDRLSTHSAHIDILSSSISRLSLSGYSLSTSVSQHRHTSIPIISSSMSSASSRAYWNSISASLLSRSAYTASSSASRNSVSVWSLSTSVSRLSTSLARCTRC